MTITNEILKSAYDSISSGYAGLEVGIGKLCQIIGCTADELTTYLNSQDGFGIMIAPNSNGTNVIGAKIVNVSNKADDLKAINDTLDAIDESIAILDANMEYDSAFELVDLTIDDYAIDGTKKYIIVTGVNAGGILLPVATGDGLQINIKNATDNDVVISAQLVGTDQDTIDGTTTLTLGTGEKVLLIDTNILTWTSF